MRRPEARHDTVQVKYTNQMRLGANQPGAREAYMLLTGKSLALSGSNQARQGRLVDALAARGDEGRATLR